MKNKKLSFATKFAIFALVVSIVSSVVTLVMVKSYVSTIRSLTSPKYVFAAVNYPKPTGYVNDFAGILSPDTERRIEAELRQYKQKTSIEIAVVTVSSLGGETVEDYTIGLAKSWGVGKKGKDNGIVFLIAPNERKMRIEVGYGMEPDMPDSAAGRIIREGIAPLFKEGKMSDGIVAGVAEIMKKLGDKPYQARLEERKAAEEKARRESEQSRESFKNFMFMAGLILATGLVVLAVVLGVKSATRKRRELKTLHDKNGSMLRDALAKIKEAEEEYPRAKEKVEVLKKDNPKEVWGNIETLVLPLPEQLAVLKQQIERLSKDQERGWKKSEEIRGSVQGFFALAAEKASYLELANSKINEVKKAKDSSANLMRSLPNMIKELAEKISHEDVTGATKDVFKDAKSKYSNASLTAGRGNINWLVVFTILGTASALLKKVTASIESDISQAKKARQEGPMLLKELPASIEEVGKKVSHSDVSSSTKQKFSEAKKKYEEGKRKTSGSPIDWLTVFAALTLADAWLNEAENGAKSDKSAAKRRRDDDSYNSSSSSSWSSSSGSDSGSSFGGFGGGGFGGGGASGSW